MEQEVGRCIGVFQCDIDLIIFQWWKKNEIYYFRLSVFVKKYLVILVLFGLVERVFSLVSYLVNKKRVCFNLFNIDNIIFMNKNMEYFW